jgi:ribosomal protein S18 acetylase RimI-like enzyme
MTAIQIYKIDLQVVEKLKHISQTTFLETFGDLNSAANMQNYLDNNLSIEQLSNELTNPDSEFYFAEINNEIIGYLKVNYNNAQTENKLQNALEIERIYVLKEFHGKKIGNVLIEKVFEIANKKAVDSIWLGVWEQNHRAISFYTKYGFEIFDKHIFKLGNDIQTDLLMKLVLE